MKLISVWKNYIQIYLLSQIFKEREFDVGASADPSLLWLIYNLEWKLPFLQC